MESPNVNGLVLLSPFAVDYEHFPPMRFGDPGAPRPTWARLVAAEPRLADLLATATAYHPVRAGFCANEVWHGPAGLRRQVIRLVGWRAASDDSVLHGCAPYEVATDTLYRALPD